jgi:hypothetical protein
VSAVPWSTSADAVLTIEPATDEIRAAHPAATRVLVEHYQGRAYPLSTDDECPFGIEKAARAWAEATGAAYMSREAS